MHKEGKEQGAKPPLYLMYSGQCVVLSVWSKCEFSFQTFLLQFVEHLKNAYMYLCACVFTYEVSYVVCKCPTMSLVYAPISLVYAPISLVYAPISLVYALISLVYTKMSRGYSCVQFHVLCADHHNMQLKYTESLSGGIFGNIPFNFHNCSSIMKIDCSVRVLCGISFR